MGVIAPVCLAEFYGVKGVAVVALVLVAYLYWTGVKEKLDRRRERKWLESKRSALKAEAAAKSAPPRGV